MPEYGFQDVKHCKIKRGHLRLGGANPSGERIEVTSLYLERGGHPVIDVMGEYHFSRDRAENWYEELCKMKAGGVTIVATYLFWIHHEETEGQFSFEGNLDIRRFIEDAKRAGLFVMLRIGPWAHGECRNGGFPDWLMKKPFPLRETNEGYMEQVRLWYERIYEEVKGTFYGDGGPVIGVQLENELVDNAEHLLALKNLAVEIGFTVPLYTVTGWNARYGARIPVKEVLPVFAAYVDAPWEEGTEPLPPSWHYVFNNMRNDAAVGKDLLADTDAGDGDEKADAWILPYEDYPFATCELGAGLPFTHHRRPKVSGMDAYALSLVKLGCGNNLVGYYMYHGGTNPIGKHSTFNETKASGYPNDYAILNYDFHTALTQYGKAREQYGLLNLLHLFLSDFGEVLAPMEYAPPLKEVLPEDTESLRYAMRINGTSGFVFVNNYARHLSLKEHPGVVIDTGSVRFPAIDVKSGVCFFMPFEMELVGALVLTYGTAQPLCRERDVYFFLGIPGVEPEYRIGEETLRGEDIRAGKIRIITLPLSDAVFLRRLSGKVMIGDGVNLYEANGSIKAIEDGAFTYRVWNGEEFEVMEGGEAVKEALLSVTDVEEPYLPPFQEELSIGGERKRTWKKLTVDSPHGMVRISYRGDAAQIYADRELVADEFYCGEDWMVPAAMLYGKECYLVYSELKKDCYLEE